MLCIWNWLLYMIVYLRMSSGQHSNYSTVHDTINLTVPKWIHPIHEQCWAVEPLGSGGTQIYPWVSLTLQLLSVLPGGTYTASTPHQGHHPL